MDGGGTSSVEISWKTSMTCLGCAALSCEEDGSGILCRGLGEV